MEAESTAAKSEVFIGGTPGSVYTVVGDNFLSSVFDIEGEQFIDGGADNHSLEFLKKFKNSNGLFFSAPTSTNMTSSEEFRKIPIIANLKSGPTTQKEFHGLRSVPLFNAKYEPYVIYKSLLKGELLLYILAGDEKDAEKLTKSAGNDEELKKIGAEHGTVAVLVWKPANSSKPILRALLSGSCSFDRVQKALDRGSRSLPFLNAPLIKTGDKPIAPPTCSPSARPSAKPAVKPSSAPAAASRARPAPTRPAAKPAAAPVRPIAARPTKPVKPQTSKPVAPTARVAPTKPTTTRPIASKPAAAPIKSKPVQGKPEPSKARQPAVSSSNSSRQPVKTAKVSPQNAVAVSEKPINSSPETSLLSTKEQPDSASPSVPAIVPPVAVPSASPIVPETVPPVVVTEDDSIIYLQTVEKNCDIVVIPPTPEPTARLDEVDEGENHKNAQPEQNAVAIKNDSFEEKSDENAISPLVDQSNSTNESTSPSEASIEQASTDTSAVLVDFGESSPLSSQQTPVTDVVLNDIPELANPFAYTGLDTSLPFVSAMSGIIASEQSIPIVPVQNEPKNIVENGNHNVQEPPAQPTQPEIVESSKHNLMQERSTILSNGNKGEPEYEKADPLIDDILDACAAESDKVDEEHSQQQTPQPITLVESEPLGMIKEEAVQYKGPKFARPYYFDVVTLPRNDGLETTIGKLETREFVHKIRSRHFVVASKNITEDVLESINHGFKLWGDSNLKCTIHPTHHNQAIAQFKAKYDEESEGKQFEVCLPIENHSLQDGTGEKYTVVRTALRDEFD